MKGNLFVIAIFLIVVFGIVVQANRLTAAQGSANDAIPISVAGSRPLATAADALELKLGVGISYEDPAWADPRDIVKAIDSPYNPGLAKQNPKLRAVIPRGGELSIILPIESRTRKSIRSPALVFEDLLRDHEYRGNPGTFRLIDLGDGDVSIVADSAHAASGTAVAQHSPLEISIWFAPSPRSGLDMLRLVCDSIRRHHTRKW